MTLPSPLQEREEEMTPPSPLQEREEEMTPPSPLQEGEEEEGEMVGRKKEQGKG